MAKILIVDDSETLRIQLREALQGAGHTVIEGVDGADGLRTAANNRDIKMIITDFNMPQMDGVTMALKMRDIPELSKVPILMLTTEATPDIKAAGKTAGILAWIVKPLVPSKVLPAIERVLSR
jgi:two-component system chemotaxis response regulator CheY